MCVLNTLYKFYTHSAVVLCFAIIFPHTSLAEKHSYQKNLYSSKEKHKPIIKGWEPVNTFRTHPSNRNLRLNAKPASIVRKLKTLTRKDYSIALQAIHFALSEVEDGRAYFWKRSKNNLQGKVTPLNVFRDKDGRICRHLIYTLSIDRYIKSVEGVACRSLNGGWRLSG